MIPINARSFIHVTMVIFDTKNEAQARARLRRRRSGSCARRPSRATASTARTWTSWTSRPTSTASTTTPTGASRETIKDALDPNGILSPGKQGIWPRALRNGARPG